MSGSFAAVATAACARDVDCPSVLGLRRRMDSNEARMRGALRRLTGAGLTAAFLPQTAGCFFTTTSVLRTRLGADAVPAGRTARPCLTALQIFRVVEADAARCRFAAGCCPRF